MKLENTLTIPVSEDQAWRVLLDIERIAPCVPGATLTSREGDNYHGRIKVKLGPIALAYSGTVRFVSQDEAAKVTVLEASGRESRGNGTAKAVVTCRLFGSGDSTDVLVETDVTITGRPAQFGRGALAEVSGALMGRFAANLAGELTTTTPDSPAASELADATTDPSPPPPAGPAYDPTGSAPGGDSPTAAHRTAEPIDLLDTAGARIFQRVVPLALGAAALLLIALAMRNRRSKPAAKVYRGSTCHPRAVTGAAVRPR
ncbi:SRPBCC family protein [Streptomyces sp. Agncl-13]|uniref:SRPBCC family protein n=1 Tax=Streptomyces sp. Agncl-13 TaxID=3400628 RepID=UPI003A83506D